MKRSVITGCLVIMLSAFLAPPAYPATNADYAAMPPFISQAVPPMVLMIMGRDHKLYKPAYNDASDIDGDGILDTTYKHSIDYYGYFDPYKCYDYATAGSDKDTFVPTSITATKYCDGTKWSGNFLNWVGTSRIDALRRVLYGGYRTVDSTSETVLEAEHINEDAHSWGKEYAGDDAPQLTPFNDPTGGTLPMCRVDWTTTQVPVTPPATGTIPIAPGCVSDGTAYYGVPQKILEVTYDDAGYTDGRQYGNTHTDMINSFSLCDLWNYSYIDDFNNADLIKTNACDKKNIGGTNYTLSCAITRSHYDTFNRILVTEFEVTSATTGTWDFAIDGVNGVEMQLFDRSTNHRSTTNPWLAISGGADDTVVAYYGQHFDSAKWTSSPYGPTATSDGGLGATNICTWSGVSCAKKLQTGVPLAVGWYRMVVRMRADNTGNSYDGVKVFYRNPDTRLSAHNGANWIVFGALADINGSHIVSTNLNYRSPQVTSGESVRFKDRAFIKNGEPSWQGNPMTNPGDKDAYGHIIICKRRLLFCVTSPQADTGGTAAGPPIIRVLKNSTHRIWEWASTERAVCSGPETPSSYKHLIADDGGESGSGYIGDPAGSTAGDYHAYYDRVKVCDTTVGLESYCKLYPGGGGTYKPAGLFQKYGESQNTVCSKSFKACNNDADCTSAESCIQNGQMFFGLMTGSYTKNMSGGVIRSNMDSMSHQVDNKNVGQLKSPGGAAGSDGFPISNLDSLRMTGFDYTNYQYSCGWIEDRPMNEGECKMWGNPIGEMMYEGMRYFAGMGAPTAAYSSGTGASGTDDKNLGLTNQGDPTNNWIKPYDKFPLCSKPFMIVLSDVNPSYDSDQLPGVDSNFATSPTFSGDLPGLTSVKDLADTIGKSEGINGTNVFIGQSGSLNDTLCTSKTAGTSGVDTTGLGSLRGICSEEPTKRGSYYSAAVAYYGKTQFGQYNKDSLGNNLPNVTTYGVALMSPVPEIKINAGGKTVKIVPTGKSVSGCLNVKTSCADKCSFLSSATTAYNTANDPTSGLKIGGCSSDAFCPTNQVVGFYVDSLQDNYGKFRVSYEDSEQGADHEMDAIVEYTYQVDDVTGQVTISLNSAYAAGCIDQVLGFVISGTTEDGTYLAVRDLDTNSSGANYTATVYKMPTSWSHTFTPSASGSTTQFLHDPLWYAAKYGGFNDQNNDNLPDMQDEWDQDHKGDPDTYFLISNPLNMEKQLTAVFEDILKKSASGTSVSILATSAEGEGALYQAYFYPEKPNVNDNSRKYWLGYVRGLFLDSYGNLREDTNQDSRLVFHDDLVLRMKLDPVTNQVTADLFSATAEDGTLDSSPTGSPPPTPDKTVAVDDIKALWEAGTMLAKRDKSTRNLYVWVDKNKDGTVNQGDFSSADSPSSTEAMTLTAANAAVLAPYLNTGTTGTAADIIQWIRGNTVTGLRNRCLPISGAVITEGTCNPVSPTGAERVWAMSDVVYSTPTTVAGPKESYDQIYGDASYLAFRKKYVNRRSVVYLGGNDGMLHAFNAGMYHVGDDPTTGTKTEHGWFVANPSILAGDDFDNGWTVPTPALGDELWAFIPYDNLPHLQWLTDPAYQHVYYVDLRPKTTDVKIFNDSLTGFSGGIDGQSNVSHPNGWGTIVIVGQRLGGGAISVTQKFDLVSMTTRTFQSSYYVLDVTNPEKPPKLLWRFTDSGLGFSTTYPGIVRIQSGSTVKWFIVVGSGPDNNIPSGTRGYDGSSTQHGKIYIVNMMDGTIAKMFDTGDANAFMGDPTVVDGDLDYTTDVIYIGSNIAGTPTGGKVYRVNTNGDLNPANWQMSTLINQGQPLLVGPSVTLDQYNSHWVLFGTGRFWSVADKTTKDQQTIYGIKDACWKENSSTNACSTTYTLADLKNTSTFAVCTNAAGGAIYDSSTGSCNSGTVAYSSYGALQTDIALNYKGWYMNLATGGVPSERVLSKSVVVGGIALVTTFTPNADPCAVQGNSNLYALYFLTGTAYNKPVVGVTGAGSSETVAKSISLGKGLPTTVGVAIGKSTKGFVQTSTGAIVEVNADPAYNVRSGPSSWREKGSGTSGVEQIYKHIVK